MTLAFPPLARRVRAVIMDSTIVGVSIWLSVWVGHSLGFSSATAMALFFVLPILILEPVLISFTGSSLGHRLMGLKVTRTDGISNINLLSALVRFLVRLSLGLFSFVFVLTTKRRQAIHDLVSGSLVVYRDAGRVSAGQAVAENALSNDYIYPPWWLRVLVGLIYAFLGAMLIGAGITSTVSAECMEQAFCTRTESALVLLANILLWVLMFGAVILAWRGRLWGCRRKTKPAPAFERAAESY